MLPSPLLACCRGGGGGGGVGKELLAYLQLSPGSFISPTPTTDHSLRLPVLPPAMRVPARPTSMSAKQQHKFICTTTQVQQQMIKFCVRQEKLEIQHLPEPCETDANQSLQLVLAITAPFYPISKIKSWPNGLRPCVQLGFRLATHLR